MLKLYANQLKMNEKAIKNKSENELRCIWILNNNKLKQAPKAIYSSMVEQYIPVWLNLKLILLFVVAQCLKVNFRRCVILKKWKHP